jgi:hypothetical protein
VLRASATLDGVTATVSATPVDVRWRASDGQQLTCEGPGTAYRTSVPADDQASDCTLLFETAGSEQLTATVTYRVGWTATTGDTGALPDLQRTTTVGLIVRAAQAVIH